MSRYVFGVTLSAHERRQAGRTARFGAALVRSHTCQVTLPDGKPCTVTYTRINGQSHQLDYAAPVSQRVWVNRRINEGIAGVEEAACANAAFAFHLAQEAEQKEMCRKMPPPGTVAKEPDAEPQLDRAKADRFAGRYAVCVRFASGWLLRLGHAFERPEPAQDELQSGRYDAQSGNGLQRVIGICNRWARRWQEPRFLAAPVPDANRVSPNVLPSDNLAPPDTPAEPEHGGTADASSPSDPAFGQWMSEVEEILEEHTGMTTADLKHCRYRDWFAAGYTSEEAVREALGTNGYDDNLDEPFRPQ